MKLCETQTVSALSEPPHCVIYTCAVYESGREEEGEVKWL